MTTFKLIGAAIALTVSSAAFAAGATCCVDLACCKDGADCCDHAAHAKTGDHVATMAGIKR